MFILRKDYHSLSETTLASKDVDKIFDGYYVEFLVDNDHADIPDKFVAMAFNIIKDFLDRKIDEKTLSSLIQKSLIDKRVNKYNYEPYLWQINDVLALWMELLDITWTQESPDYQTYLKKLPERLMSLVEEYQTKWESLKKEN